MSAEMQTLLENEYEHEPVPSSKRRSLLSVSLVWVGFPMVITGALTGGGIVASLGFAKGLAAILLGNFILFAYVATQSAFAAKTGMSFALLTSKVFGKRGFRFVSGLLSTVVIGWFAVQTGLTGASLHSSLGMSTLMVNLLAGLLFMGITIVGTRALTVIGALSVPIFLILGVYGSVLGFEHSSLSQVINYVPAKVGGVSFGLAVTMVIALFVDSGTMTPDFTRWARSSKDAVIATFSAFPFANFMSMLFGAIIVAAGISSNGDFSAVIAKQAGWGPVIAVLFLVLNSGSVCSHCLYNAATGWSQILHTKFRWMAFILGLVGILAAMAGMWNVFLSWLNILGVIVPGIGGSIIAHFILNRRTGNSYPMAAFIGWATGAVLGFVVSTWAPMLSSAIVGMVTSFLGYAITIRLLKNSVHNYPSEVKLDELSSS